MTYATVRFGPPIHTCCLCGHRERVPPDRWWNHERHFCADKRACLIRVRDLTKKPLDGSPAKGLPRSPEPYRPTYGISVTT